MGTPFNAMGSRVADRVREAEHHAESVSAAAELAEGAKRERAQTMTASDLIVAHAEALSVQFKVAQQLGHAVSRALNKQWSGGRYEVSVTQDLPRDQYVVEIAKIGPWTTPSQTYVVDEETLAQHTLSVSAFHGWIEAVGRRLATMFKPLPLSTPGGEQRLVERHARAAEAREELEALGFHRSSTDEQPRFSEEDAQAAIESIRRTLDGRSDS